jgi:hypothetical protein
MPAQTHISIEEDFAAWADETADLLEQRRFGEVDLADLVSAEDPELVVDPAEEGLVSAAGVQGRAVPVWVAGAHRSPESG